MSRFTLMIIVIVLGFLLTQGLCIPIGTVKGSTNNPIAWWRLDENSGGTANDSSGNGYNGTITGASWTVGKSGSALSFDGFAGKNVNVPNCSANIGSNFTLTAWIKAPSASSWRVFLAKGAKTTGHFEMNLTPNNKFQFYANDIGVFESISTVADNKWHHVAVTYNGSSVIIYVDGIAQAPQSASGTVANSTDVLYMGSLIDGTNRYIGVLDEVSIYNNTLASADIQTIYKQENGGLLAWWKLDENTGSVASDSSGSGYIGTVTGASWAAGKSGSALSFDGTSGKKVDIPSCGANIGSNFTLTAWIKAPSGSTFRTFLAKGDKTMGHYEMNVTPQNKFQFYANDIGVFESTNTVTDNYWHYVAVTYNGSNVVIYVDGIAQTPQSASGTVTNSTAELYLGSLIDGTNRYNGVLDGVRIYNRTLASIEIQNIFNNESSTVQNLLAWWKLDENSGGVANDSSGSRYNGTVTGAGWTAGKSGSALSFDGSSGKYMNVSNCSANIGSNFTLMAWIKAPTGSSWRVLLAKGLADNGHYEINLTPDNKFQFYAPAIGAFDSVNEVADNNWHHVAVTYNGSSVIMYFDGNGQIPQSASGTVANSTAELFLGSLVDGTFPYNGALDGVRVYNRVLSSSEIKDIYSKDYGYSTTPTTTGLIDEWAFEGQHDRIIAEKNSKYNGYMHAATWKQGKVGNALKLYGLGNSFGEIPGFADNIGSSFTISVWIKSADYNKLYQKKTILEKGTIGTAGFYSLYTDNDGYFHFNSNELGDLKSNARVLDDCEWHHLAVAYNGRQLNLIVDGNVDKTSSISGSIANLTGTLYLGGRTTSDFYWGLIDQARMYNRPLNLGEIQSLFYEYAAPAAPQQETGTIVPKANCGTLTDAIDGFSADRAYTAGSWGYVDGGASVGRIYQENTYSIYGLHYMLKSRRESGSNLSYRFTVPNATYKVKLYFVEAEKTASGQRKFDVKIEGTNVLTDYDIFADAKERFTGVMKQFTGIQVSDGRLDIDFVKKNGDVSIAGIVVQKQDSQLFPAPTPARMPRAPVFIDPPVKKHFRDSSSVYNIYTGKWMHFGLLQDIDDSCWDDSIAAVEMTNGGRGTWSWLGIPQGITFNDYAPDVVYDSVSQKYHMFTGSASHGIRHYTNTDTTLMNLQLENASCLPGNHTAYQWDPEVWKVGNKWNIITTRGQYQSDDLYTWTELGTHLKAAWPDFHRRDIVKDYTDNGYHGTISGAQWVNGATYWIPALSFNGISDHVSFPSFNLNIGSSFTLATRIKAPSGSSWRVFVAKGPKTSPGHFEMNITPDNKFQFYAPNIGAFTSTYTVADNTVHHIAVTYNGSSLTLYVDGVAQTPQSASGAVTNSTDTMYFGSLIDGTCPFGGEMDEVRIYDAALTEYEIQTMYRDPRYVDSKTIPHCENTCIFYWKGMWWNIRDHEQTIYKSLNGVDNWILTDTKIISDNSGCLAQGIGMQNRERLADCGNTFGYEAIVQDGRAFLTYSVYCEENPTYSGYLPKTCIQVVELQCIDGNLYIDGNASFDFNLGAEQRGY